MQRTVANLQNSFADRVPWNATVIRLDVLMKTTPSCARDALLPHSRNSRQSAFPAAFRSSDVSKHCTLGKYPEQLWPATPLQQKDHPTLDELKTPTWTPTSVTCATLTAFGVITPPVSSNNAINPSTQSLELRRLGRDSRVQNRSGLARL